MKSEFSCLGIPVGIKVEVYLTSVHTNC